MLIENLYEEHQEELMRFARSIASEPKEAEDLLQETFLRALSHMRTLNELNHYQQRAWLYKVLRNIRYDRYRKQKYEQLTDDSVEPEISLDDYSVIEVKELLQTLPDDLRDVFYKRYWLGLTSKQIAKPLGLSDATIRYRLQTARSILKKQIEPSGG